MQQRALTMFALHRTRITQIGRFGVVGVSGTLVNTIILWVLVRQMHIVVILASITATQIAIVNNFILNDSWTFRNHGQGRSWTQRLLRFNGVALGGLCITVVVVYVATTFAHIGLISANLVASGVTMVWNYLVNSMWTWRSPNDTTYGSTTMYPVQNAAVDGSGTEP